MDEDFFRRTCDGEDPIPYRHDLADLMTLFFSSDQVLGLSCVAPAEARLDGRDRPVTRNPERAFDAALVALGVMPLREAELHARTWCEIRPADQRAVVEMILKGRKEAEAA